MSIWKRLAAATSNLTIGSPIAGLLAGDREAQDAPNRLELSEQEVPFTLGIIALSAKMAKADGHITRDEVEAFKDAFKVSPGEMKEAARAFNLAKRDATGYEVFAAELVELFKGNRKLLEDVLEGLFHIAKADEEVHPREEQFLDQVAKLFGFTDAEFSHIKARHVVAAKRNPYEALGVEPSISNEDLKSHYRRLVADNHPDKLLARGVPVEFVTIATEKVATITAAYEAIAKERSTDLRLADGHVRLQAQSGP
jgi:DnaJ like chaperone protein